MECNAIFLVLEDFFRRVKLPINCLRTRQFKSICNIHIAIKQHWKNRQFDLSNLTKTSQIFVTGLTQRCCINVKYSRKAFRDEFSEMLAIDCQYQTTSEIFGFTNCQKTLSLKRGLNHHIRNQ